MKLVAAFVPGTMADAVAKVNELNMAYEFVGMQPHSRQVPWQREGADSHETPNMIVVGGYAVFFRLSNLRVIWARNYLELVEHPPEPKA